MFVLNHQISGGMLILVKYELRPGIKYLEQKCSEYIWIKLCKDFFGVSNDIFLLYLNQY